ncbi:hypothetical protein R1flu_019418 [Riccia fluitans]|uniref:Uncharacterized protein n=1 Tax=Riccia fluitans TaxID=41844 RepID=A0ABD1ZK28_9MARC
MERKGSNRVVSIRMIEQADGDEVRMIWQSKKRALVCPAPSFVCELPRDSCHALLSSIRHEKTASKTRAGRMFLPVVHCDHCPAESATMEANKKDAARTHEQHSTAPAPGNNFVKEDFAPPSLLGSQALVKLLGQNPLEIFGVIYPSAEFADRLLLS